VNPIKVGAVIVGGLKFTVGGVLAALIGSDVLSPEAKAVVGLIAAILLAVVGGADVIIRQLQGSNPDRPEPALKWTGRPGGGAGAPLCILVAGAAILAALGACSATTQGRIQTAEGAVGVVVFGADLAVEAAIEREHAALCVTSVAIYAAASVGEDVLRDLGDDVELDEIPGVAVYLGRCAALYPSGFPVVLDGDELRIVDGVVRRLLPPVRRYVDQLLARVSEDELGCRKRQAIRAVLWYIESAAGPAADFLAGRVSDVVFPPRPIEYGECEG
jgi:hypothetical protein